MTKIIITPIVTEEYLEEYPWVKAVELRPFSIAFFVLYTVGLPAIYATLLYRHRVEIREKKSEHTWWFDFLFSDYKSKFYYFDIVMLARRVLVAFFVILAQEHPSEYASHLICILLLFSCFVTAIRPFANPMALMTDIIVSVSLAGSYLCLTLGFLTFAYVFVWAPGGILILMILSKAIRYIQKRQAHEDYVASVYSNY